MKITPTKRLIAVGIIIGLTATAYIIHVYFLPEAAPQNNEPQNSLSTSTMQTIPAKINDVQFALYAPQTPSERRVGLAAFDRLQPHEGMVFKGLQPDSLSIWMKNMKFDIDVIWLNGNDAVTYIEKSIPKSSYPKIYQNPASAPSTYLIELPAGTVEQMTINIGDKVLYE